MMDVLYTAMIVDISRKFVQTTFYSSNETFLEEKQRIFECGSGHEAFLKNECGVRTARPLCGPHSRTVVVSLITITIQDFGVSNSLSACNTPVIHDPDHLIHTQNLGGNFGKTKHFCRWFFCSSRSHSGTKNVILQNL